MDFQPILPDSLDPLVEFERKFCNITDSFQRFIAFLANWHILTGISTRIARNYCLVDKYDLVDKLSLILNLNEFSLVLKQRKNLKGNPTYFSECTSDHLQNFLQQVFSCEPFGQAEKQADLLFVQFIFVQPVFVQSISSNPNLTYPNRIERNGLDEKFERKQVERKQVGWKLGARVQ